MVISVATMPGFEFDGARIALERLRSAPSADSALALYEDVFRIDAEALAERHYADPPLDALFVIVGPQSFGPTLAVLASPAHRVVLLHAEGEGSTRAYAVDVVNRAGLRGKAPLLRGVGAGADVLRVHAAMRETWAELGRPERVGVDVTGGYDTTSATALLAAAAFEGSSARQIRSTKLRVRDQTFGYGPRRVDLGEARAAYDDRAARSA